jgi:hypoxia up-regulated 1
MKNFLFVLLICFISSIKAQVLGIDFGTEFWKAALISPGKNLVIVENSRSERKTLNSVSIIFYVDCFP